MATVRRDAAALRETADSMRARARAITAQVDSVEWNSRAASVFRAQVDAMTDDLARTAAALDQASAELLAHAGAVDEVKDAIRQAEQWVWNRLAEVGTLLSGVVPSTPASGSKDWLHLWNRFVSSGW